jgi:hypothetical protein
MAPARIPDFNFNFGFGETGEVPPLTPPVPLFGGSPLGDDPFRSGRIFSESGTKGKGRRLPVMANLFEVFAYEGRGKGEYRHPTGPAAEVGFSEALASGSDFFSSSFGKGKSRSVGRAKPFTLGIGKIAKSKKSKRFKLW